MACVPKKPLDESGTQDKSGSGWNDDVATQMLTGNMQKSACSAFILTRFIDLFWLTALKAWSNTVSLHPAPIIAVHQLSLCLDVINKCHCVSAGRVSGANAAKFLSLDAQLTPQDAVDAPPPLSLLYRLSPFSKKPFVSRAHMSGHFFREPLGL